MLPVCSSVSCGQLYSSVASSQSRFPSHLKVFGIHLLPSQLNSVSKQGSSGSSITSTTYKI